MASGESCVVVAIPVCNEQDRIGACIAALASQRSARIDRLVLLLNNCTDRSMERVREIAPRLGFPCDAIECQLKGAEATAGFARSLAMQHAAAGLREHDVLITTDADSAADPYWLAENLRALRHGADAVCGQAEIDPADAAVIPEHLHQDDQREGRLGALLDEISWLLDPDPFDPWPRHTQHSGASIAVTVAAWRRAGGMPPVPTGEDRAFVENLRRVDARIRHAPSARVTVSGRTLGRAIGGMADTIRRRIIQQDEFADSAIEPAVDRYRRATLRAAFRAMRCTPAPDADICHFAQTLSVTDEVIRTALAQPFFGQAWADLETDCPSLLQRRVRFVDLPEQIEIATEYRDRARAPAAAAAPANPLVAA